MTVIHIALFRWKPETTSAQVGAFEEALAAMPAKVGGVVSLRFGTDLGLRDGNFDYGVVAELTSPEDVPGYLDHPAHQWLVRAHSIHMIGERVAVQFTGDTTGVEKQLLGVEHT